MPSTAPASGIDEILLRDLSGRDKLATLINVRFGGVARWARQRGFIREHVHMTISGSRPGSKVRQRLAEDLGVSREEIDRLIDADAVARSGSE